MVLVACPFGKSCLFSHEQVPRLAEIDFTLLINRTTLSLRSEETSLKIPNHNNGIGFCLGEIGYDSDYEYLAKI